MPPINLKPIKKFVEQQMTDQILIYEDPEGTTDDVFDPVTGQYTPVNPDDTPLYRGMGFVVPLNVFPSQDLEGGATTLSTDFEVHIPLETEPIPADATVVVTASMRNANLVNVLFTVRSSQDNSFSVDQTLRVYLKSQRILH